jgi:hypothetical protein
MKTFEDKLQASAQRIAEQENRKMHVPQNPLTQKKTYWGWVATPAAAVAGIVFGLSLHLFVTSEPDIQYVLGCSSTKARRLDAEQQTDTIRILQLVHDTLYLTQIVEKEKIVVREATDAMTTETSSAQEEADTPACTSIQCDGINYAILASN